MKITKVELRGSRVWLHDVGFYVNGNLVETFEERYHERINFWYRGLIQGFKIAKDEGWFETVEEETVVLEVEEEQVPASTLNEMLTLGTPKVKK